MRKGVIPVTLGTIVTGTGIMLDSKQQIHIFSKEIILLV